MLSLSDIQNAPTDLTQLQLWAQRNGHLPPPAPPLETPPLVPPATVTAPMSPVTPAQPKAETAAMTPPTSVAETPDAHHLAGLPASDIGGAPTAVKPMVPPAVGTAAESRGELEDLEAKRKADTLASHPTLLGKIGHVAGRIGSIAGAAVAPGVTAMIPGSQLNLNEREAGLKGELAKRTAAEGQEEEHQAREKNLESETEQHEEQTKGLKEAQEYDTPEKRQDYMAKNPDLFGDLSQFEKNDYVLSGKFPQKEPAEPKEVTLQQRHSNAVADAIKRGVDPAEDPAVKQYEDAIQRIQKEPKESNAVEQVRKDLLAAMQSGDTAKVETLGKQLEKLSDPSGEKEILRQLAVQSKQQQIAEKNAKDTALSPAAQQILINTEPTLDQVDQLLAELEPMKHDNKSRLTLDRIGYALGHASPQGTLAADISKLELDRVMAGARVLKGSSRAYQALELAMKHAPNSWVDTPELMYDKLTNIRQNLADVIEDAKKYGPKNLPANVKTGTEGEGHKGGGTAPTVRTPPADPGMEWRRNKRTGEYRQFPVNNAQPANK